MAAKLGSDAVSALKRSEGFTLIELLASIIILGLIAVAFVNIFSAGFGSIFFAGNRDRAMSYASEVMEQLYRVHGNAGFEGNTMAVIQGVVDDVQARASGYAIEYSLPPSVEPFADHEQDGYKVTVTVRYNDGDGKVTLTSFFRRGGS